MQRSRVLTGQQGKPLRMNRLNILVLIFLAVAIISCKKNNRSNVACGKKDPVNEIEWLRKTVDSLKEAKQPGAVMVLKQNGRDYINIQLAIWSCYPCGIHTCDGSRLDFEKDSTLIRSLQTGKFETIANF